MKILTVVLGVLVLVLLLSFGIFVYTNEDEVTTAPVPNNTNGTNSNGGGETATPVTPPDTDESPTPDSEDAASSENIIVTTPIEGETVSSPLTVQGQARTFEQTVNFRLSAADGTVLVEDVTTTNAEDIGQFGPYETMLEYPVQSAGSAGVLEVFQNSARDGSEIDKVTISVIFEGG